VLKGGKMEKVGSTGMQWGKRGGGETHYDTRPGAQRRQGPEWGACRVALLLLLLLGPAREAAGAPGAAAQ
jgi:hypothetical protein